MKKKVFWSVLLCLGTLVAGVVVPAEPAAAADPTLKCEANNPLRPANGAIEGMGSAEHARLHRELFIPNHELRCPQTIDKVLFTRTSEAIAIQTLQRRWVPNTSPAKPSLFIGVNQPLTFDEWNVATQSSNNPGIFIGAGTLIWHFPLMMDAFVVTANIPCSDAFGQTLVLDPLTLSLIYSGAVTRWGDPALRPQHVKSDGSVVQDNPWLEGCGAPISISVRDGASWSNAVIKDYMSKRNPVFAALKSRDTLATWPPALEIDCRAMSDPEMADCALASGGISYMRYSTAIAHGLTPIKLKNAKNQTPDPAASGETWPSGCTAAVPNPTVAPAAALAGDTTTASYNASAHQLTLPLTMATDWSQFSMTYSPAGYPMCAMSFVVSLNIGPTGTSQMESDAWKDHYRVMWAPSKQEALKDFGYAPIPSWIIGHITSTDPYSNP